MQSLTDKEKMILDYISENIQRNGYSPSVRDIKNDLGIKSTSTVHAYLERLETKGFIHKESGKSRTLRVGEEDDGASSVRVPVLGRVAAGEPIYAEQNYEGYINFSAAESGHTTGELFALRIAGTSMIDAGIMNGDYVVVEQGSYAEDGEIVVALIDDEATVKTFYKEKGHYRLQPENTTMKPIIVDEVTILGRVVACVRYY